ncbi:MAG: NTP transferase domain-containing protein [Akkermansiaceae bacterium]|nr:NTP transferase domain-containing protein [Akkermansiaceae bacterium]
MNPVAVITARAGSKRLPGKNMLPVNGRPLAEWSIHHALEAGLETIVTTDIPELLQIARTLGCHAVERPAELATDECSHAETIRHALEAAGHSEHPCILLQPTSPFREDRIIERCLKAAEAHPNSTILSTRDVHRFVVGGENTGTETLWDGCVAVYPSRKVGDYSEVIAVPNILLNSLQIDAEDDYVQACVLASSTITAPNPVAEADAATCMAALRNAGIHGEVTLVARSDGQPIPQDRPVVWINHCHGWDRGRADVLFLIANPHMQQTGIAPATREVATKARLVIVRDNGTGDWLRSQLPVICGKHVEIRRVTEPLSNHLTTGAIASNLLHRTGCRVTRVGFSPPAVRAASSRNQFNHPGVSREIALLQQSGTDRKP